MALSDSGIDLTLLHYTSPLLCLSGDSKSRVVWVSQPGWMGLYSLPQLTTVGLDDVAFFSSNFVSSGQEAVFLCPKIVIALGVLVTIVCAMHHSGNSTMQVDRPPDDRTNLAAPTAEGDASSEDLTNSLEGEWMRAEERYGLVRQ